MTREEQIAICKACAAADMWGSGTGRTIVGDLDRKMTQEVSWVLTYREYQKEAERESVGVISDEVELRRLLAEGYRLHNGDTIFYPKSGSGMYKFVTEELYTKYHGRSQRSIIMESIK